MCLNKVKISHDVPDYSQGEIKGYKAFARDANTGLYVFPYHAWEPFRQKEWLKSGTSKLYWNNFSYRAGFHMFTDEPAAQQWIDRAYWFNAIVIRPVIGKGVFAEGDETNPGDELPVPVIVVHELYIP